MNRCVASQDVRNNLYVIIGHISDAIDVPISPIFVVTYRSYIISLVRDIVPLRNIIYMFLSSILFLFSLLVCVLYYEDACGSWSSE